MSPSHSFAEPCSGRDCLVCGPLPTPEDQAYASLDTWLEDSVERDHQYGLHDAGNGYGGAPNVNCPMCFPPVRHRVEPLPPLDPDDDAPF
jgi:hypothetical protein